MYRGANMGQQMFTEVCNLPVCIHCGGDLTLDKPVKIGDLDYDPRGDIHWHGEKINLTAAERIVLGTLVKDAGRCISYSMIDERIGHEGNSNVPTAMISNIRSKMSRRAPPPIETIRGVGYRWVG